MIYTAKEKLGWTTDEFLDSTPKFFVEMVKARTRSIQSMAHGYENVQKPKEEKIYYWDEVKAEVLNG